MASDESYTTDDIARLLKVSKLTVYDLIKKGELKSYRVGRQIRVDSSELENYKIREQEVKTTPKSTEETTERSIVISGQDSSLDILSRSLEEKHHFQPLRSYRGSLDSLIAMYEKHADIVSTHLFDGDSEEYNIPYIRKVLVSMPFVVIKFIERQAGLYTAKENPKQIHTWNDLTKRDVALVNREQGAGARVLLDEQLRLHNIKRSQVTGYNVEQSSHLAVASAVASGQADVGVGIESAANMAGIDFIPLVNENYDLVVLDTDNNSLLIDQIVKILKEATFRDKLKSLGYMTDNMGDIIWRQ